MQSLGGGGLDCSYGEALQGHLYFGDQEGVHDFLPGRRRGRIVAESQTCVLLSPGMSCTNSTYRVVFVVHQLSQNNKVQLNYSEHV